MITRGRFFGTVAAFALVPVCSAATEAAPAASHVVSAGDFPARCVALARQMQGKWPDADTHIQSVDYRPAGTSAPAGPPGVPTPKLSLPAHCEVIASMHHRTGIDGQHYAIRFHVRLPEEWNGRLFFEGGGGLNGNLGSALGMIGFTQPPALSRGYAVVSQDSGHDAMINRDLTHGGDAAFGFDPQARGDYGGASLKPVTLAARALTDRIYGALPRYTYFVGCSKGGQEGMMAAQRYPALFNGIVSGAPGFSLPRAALAEAWDTQQFAAVVRAKGEPVTAATLAQSFSNADLDLARGAVLAACDADDGLRDGIVGAFRECTSAKVLPELKRLTCAGAKKPECLIPAQVEALRQIHEGPHNSKGEPLYAGFPWDGGWAGRDWRGWKIGAADGSMPSLNVAMGSVALATIFTTPPTAPKDPLAYVLGFDFDRDAPLIYAKARTFTRSAWQDIAARSSDLSAFGRRGGRIIVYQGVSDPVFSVSDTLAWWDEVNTAEHGTASHMVRVFPVAGMNHCAGGPATDQLDAFSALVAWVEHGHAPDRIVATAGAGSPWPGRIRPICPYPLIARPKSPDVDPEKADSFECVRS